MRKFELFSLVLGLLLCVTINDARQHPVHAWSQGANSTGSTVRAGTCHLSADIREEYRSIASANVTFISLSGVINGGIVASTHAYAHSMGISTPFSNFAEEACELTKISGIEHSITPSSCKYYKCATSIAIEFRGSESGGEEFVWRAEISGDVDGVPTATVLKRPVQGWSDH